MKLLPLILMVSVSHVSCRTAIHTYTDPRIPAAAQMAFRTLTLDSINQSKISKTVTVMEGMEMLTVQYSGVIEEEGNVKGKFNISRIQEGFGVDQKEHSAFLKGLFCCTNHNPKHCAKTKSEMRDMETKHTCSAWTVVFN